MEKNKIKFVSKLGKENNLSYCTNNGIDNNLFCTYYTTILFNGIDLPIVDLSYRDEINHFIDFSPYNKECSSDDYENILDGKYKKIRIIFCRLMGV